MGARCIRGLIWRRQREGGGKHNIVVYDRRDSRDRWLLNADSIFKQFGQELPKFHVSLLHDLSSITFAQRFEIFATSSVFFAPHGGWSMNMLFMSHTSLVFTIAKPVDMWLSYRTWDGPHGEASKRVVLVKPDDTLRVSKQLAVTCAMHNAIEGVTVYDIKPIVTIIRETFR